MVQKRNQNVTNMKSTSSPSVHWKENNIDTTDINAGPSLGQISNNNELVTEMHIAADFVEKIHNLKYILSKDLLACDAKWTLFVAAALSYRYDSQLKPFPQIFGPDNYSYNIDSVTNIIKDTPKLKTVLKQIFDENYDDLDTSVIDLLHWVQITLNDPYLKTLDNVEYNDLLKKLNYKSDIARPTHIFEVCHLPSSKSESIFQRSKTNFETKFAFHGSKLDSFYSIVNHGLHQHLNKNSLFGEGCYLSSELSVSINYSPNGAGWGASSCGSILSCVAVCEYVENPEHIKIKDDKNSKSEIPNTYIIITNNDIVRVRYLLFYGSCFQDENSPKNVLFQWFSRHKYMISLACYTLFLTSIGFANSSGGVFLRHYISKKASSFAKIFFE